MIGGAVLATLVGNLQPAMLGLGIDIEHPGRIQAQDIALRLLEPIEQGVSISFWLAASVGTAMRKSLARWLL